MRFRPYHNPNLSLPVVRRRVSEEFLQLLMETGDVLATRGRCLTWSSCWDNRQAYGGVLRRLRKAGLVVERRGKDNEPMLTLTDKAASRVPIECRPERYWKYKWNGLWYVLTYDVPESNRAYRNVLRGFLTRLRMGWLHRSVWVTPRDIRPEYDDLVRGAAVGRYAFLLEAETVLGQSPLEVVEGAWDMDRLQQIQHWYHQVFAENLERLRTADVPEEELVELARDEMSAYLSAMQEDPLLPRVLWPPGYRGEAAYRLHKAFVREVARRL
ncbi:MAG: hypothetical protein JXB04_05200 [Kiritimatiellae bacterium]|nr:hypothetical protein [Kiritimatiellia bacterium]